MSSSPMTQRRALRLLWQAPVSVYDGSTQFRAELHNISEGGAFITISPPIPLGTGLSFWLAGPDGRVLIRGYVRWTRSLESVRGEPVGSGIEFYDPDGKIRDEVVALIQALSLA